MDKPLTLLLFVALISCQPSNQKSELAWGDLQKVTSLDSLKQTDFVITLESPLANGKNTIYAPAFMYAWDKIKAELKSPIVTGSANSMEFRLLNKYNSHQNSLTEQEYAVTTEIVDGAITAKAFFNKTLPFETKLQAMEGSINFGPTKVAGFGMYYYKEHIIKFTQILYYKDDNHFVLKLIPKDQQHEIVLAKGLEAYQTLQDGIQLTNKLVAQGKKEQVDNRLLWKYQIAPEDMFVIPVIKFNIETHYSTIEGQKFLTSDEENHFVKEAYQRTAFVFDENGAVIESEAEVAADSTSAAEPIVTHPKKLIFDQPFLIIIKRADKVNPYFVMRVANPELMTRK
jgi:hypothetical protein